MTLCYVSCVGEVLISLYKMKYWQEIYFGGLVDFSATANIKPVVSLATGYIDVIRHVDQMSNGKVAVCHADETTRW